MLTFLFLAPTLHAAEPNVTDNPNQTSESVLIQSDQPISFDLQSEGNGPRQKKRRRKTTTSGLEYNNRTIGGLCAGLSSGCSGLGLNVDYIHKYFGAGLSTNVFASTLHARAYPIPSLRMNVHVGAHFNSFSEITLEDVSYGLAYDFESKKKASWMVRLEFSYFQNSLISEGTGNTSAAISVHLPFLLGWIL